MPYKCAKAVCAKFCAPIAGALIPLFGPDFTSICAPQNSPEFCRWSIDPAIIDESRAEAERYKTESLAFSSAPSLSPPSSTSSGTHSPKRIGRRNRHFFPPIDVTTHPDGTSPVYQRNACHNMRSEDTGDLHFSQIRWGSASYEREDSFHGDDEYRLDDRPGEYQYGKRELLWRRHESPGESRNRSFPSYRSRGFRHLGTWSATAPPTPTHEDLCHSGWGTTITEPQRLVSCGNVRRLEKGQELPPIESYLRSHDWVNSANEFGTGANPILSAWPRSRSSQWEISGSQRWDRFILGSNNYTGHFEACEPRVIPGIDALAAGMPHAHTTSTNQSFEVDIMRAVRRKENELSLKPRWQKTQTNNSVPASTLKAKCSNTSYSSPASNGEDITTTASRAVEICNIQQTPSLLNTNMQLHDTSLKSLRDSSQVVADHKAARLLLGLSVHDRDPIESTSRAGHDISLSDTSCHESQLHSQHKRGYFVENDKIGDGKPEVSKKRKENMGISRRLSKRRRESLSTQ